MPKGSIICDTSVSDHMSKSAKRAKMVSRLRTNEAANALCHFQDYQEDAGIRRAHVERSHTLMEGT